MGVKGPEAARGGLTGGQRWPEKPMRGLAAPFYQARALGEARRGASDFSKCVERVSAREDGKKALGVGKEGQETLGWMSQRQAQATALGRWVLCVCLGPLAATQA